MMLKLTPRAAIRTVEEKVAKVNSPTTTMAANPSASHQIGRYRRSSSSALRHRLVANPDAIFETPMVDVSAPIARPRLRSHTYSVTGTGAVIQIPAPEPPTTATPSVSDGNPCAVAVMASPTTQTVAALRMIVMFIAPRPMRLRSFVLCRRGNGGPCGATRRT